MLSRRGFSSGLAGVFDAGLTEAAFAQRAAVPGAARPIMVWLNGNEYPEVPPQASIEAMARVIASSNHYHYQEFPAFYSARAASQGLNAEQILVGAGSSEVLHAAVEAFTSPSKPLITSWPTYEAAPELTKAKGHALAKIPLTPTKCADVHRLVEEAEKAGGGLIYWYNPNNPASTMTGSSDLTWLVDHLPANTLLLVDEAYLHYATAPDASTAIPFVKDNKSVIVARTFRRFTRWRPACGLRRSTAGSDLTHGAIPQPT